MKIKTSSALVVLCLAAHGEAFNFGELLGTAASTLKGASTATNFLGVYKQDGVVCPEVQFKAKVVSTNSLCQLVEDFESMDACRSFGSSCVSIPGQWGCGSVETRGEPQRGCLFRPRRAPRGRTLPKIIFDFEDDDVSMEYYNDGGRCVFGGRKPVNYPPTPFHATHLDDDDDAILVDYSSASDFYAKTTISDLERYHDIFTENTDSKSKTPAQSLVAIIKALDLAGIRYPIGKNTCGFCKGVCNKIFSGDNIERCKYDACVKFLGGYKGTEATPSCDLISLP
ncbi:hypothetical protein BGX30_014372 [Mortierella sp. GBA39]|nr:hypothetical protein BGX30_014372 [Mortierella sp. GBA39]